MKFSAEVSIGIREGEYIVSDYDVIRYYLKERGYTPKYASDEEIIGRIMSHYEEEGYCEEYLLGDFLYEIVQNNVREYDYLGVSRLAQGSGGSR